MTLFLEPKQLYFQQNNQYAADNIKYLKQVNKASVSKFVWAIGVGGGTVMRM